MSILFKRVMETIERSSKVEKTSRTNCIAYTLDLLVVEAHCGSTTILYKGLEIGSMRDSEGSKVLDALNDKILSIKNNALNEFLGVLK